MSQVLQRVNLRAAPARFMTDLQTRDKIRDNRTDPYSDLKAGAPIRRLA